MPEEKNLQEENPGEQITPCNGENVNEKILPHFPGDSHIAKLPINNQQPATHNMETHAHHSHKAPGKKYRRYIQSFYKDLKSDTRTFTNLIKKSLLT